MNVGSLFSGIGGLDHGLANAGFTHRFFCENDAWRREVLAQHWPGVPIFQDVRDVAVRPVADADAGRHDHGELGGARHRERDHDAVRNEITRRRGSGVPIYDDVRDVERTPQPDRELGRPGQLRDRGDAGTVAGMQAGSLDLLCGGFPCQDLSVAGQRKGLTHEGGRSNLFFEFARIIDAVRPRWVLVENVPGLLSSNGGRDFGIVLGTLADLGYGMGWRVLDSRFFGVPQRRRRVFILATESVADPRAAAQRAGQVLAVGTRCTGHPPTGTETGQDVARPLGSSSRPGRTGGGQRYDLDNDTYVPVLRPRRDVRPMPRIVEQAMSAKWAKGTSGPASDETQNLTVTHALTSEGADASEDGTGRGTSMAINGADVRRLTPTECERLQALPDNWTNHGPDSRRYSALGDAVTATVGEWIGRRLIAAHQKDRGNE